jgi:hypothetical protein
MGLRRLSRAENPASKASSSRRQPEPKLLQTESWQVKAPQQSQLVPKHGSPSARQQSRGGGRFAGMRHRTVFRPRASPSCRTCEYRRRPSGGMHPISCTPSGCVWTQSRRSTETMIVDESGVGHRDETARACPTLASHALRGRAIRRVARRRFTTPWTMLTAPARIRNALTREAPHGHEARRRALLP